MVKNGPHSDATVIWGSRMDANSYLTNANSQDYTMRGGIVAGSGSGVKCPLMRAGRCLNWLQELIV